MEISQNDVEKTVKRLLARVVKEPIEIYPGFNTGLTLPAGTSVGIMDPISQILPLCVFDSKSDPSVWFVVYPKGKDSPMFEIVWKKSGQILHENGDRFENPPMFDILFENIRNIHKANLAYLIKTNTPGIRADIFSYRCHTLILKHLMIEQQKIKD